MSNFRRKRPRTKVRCTLCTPFRDGNSKKGGQQRYMLRAPKIGDE